MAKAKGDVFLRSLTPVSLTAEQEVVSDLTDTGDVMGVAWSPKYRAWRSYLHIGQKQVHHALHETKAQAIAARRSAEVEFCRSTVTREQVKEWYPAAAFRRHHRAPKVAVRKRALLRAGTVMREVSRLVNRAVAEWPEDETGRRRSPMTRSEELSFGRRIGQVLALAEYLRMTGDVRIEEIEAGMREEVGRIVKYKV
jgi:hypothetical protein